jgi:hypothetical protein
MPDGSAAPGVTVLVQGGRILDVGSDLSLPAGARPLSLEGVLAPGFVDAFSAFGTDRPAQEDSHRFTPMLRSVDAVDFKESEAWDDLRNAGVTSIHVLPAPSNVQAGWSSLLTTGGKGDRILSAKVREVLSVAIQAVNDSDFGPSSQSGAVELLRNSNPQQIAGIQKHGAIVHVDSAESIRSVRKALGKNIERRWLLWGDVGQYGGELRDELVGLQLPSAGWSSRDIETLKRLHKAGVKVVFGTWAFRFVSNPLKLRRAAIFMSRVTGDPAAAFAAVTSNAAAFIGSDDVGAIAKGRRADFVLWSAHPLDATARIQAVMIGGQTVSRGSAQEK